METQGERLYNQVLEEAATDPNIIGLILAAGRGKGFATEDSDYDLLLIVKDGKGDQYRVKCAEYNIENLFDIRTFALLEFREHAALGSPTEWDRYNFAHLKAVVDKTGEIQPLIDEKATLPPKKVNDLVDYCLDAYINSYYRSIKNHRAGNHLAAHLDAAESVPHLITALFALEGKVKPYNKYLGWELQNFPLAKLPWEAQDFLQKIATIVTSGDFATQREVFRAACQIFKASGHAGAIAKWDGYYLG